MVRARSSELLYSILLEMHGQPNPTISRTDIVLEAAFSGVVAHIPVRCRRGACLRLGLAGARLNHDVRSSEFEGRYAPVMLGDGMSVGGRCLVLEGVTYEIMPPPPVA